MKEKNTYKITGQLLASNDALDKLIAAGNADITVDFSECTFISVPGLEWLEEILMRATSSNVNVVFTGMPPALYKVFKVARIDSILNACGSPSSSAHAATC